MFPKQVICYTVVSLSMCMCMCVSLSVCLSLVLLLFLQQFYTPLRGHRLFCVTLTTNTNIHNHQTHTDSSPLLQLLFHIVSGQSSKLQVRVVKNQHGVEPPLQ